MKITYRGLRVLKYYSGISPLRSPMVLNKSDLNGEVTVLLGAKSPIHSTVANHLGLSESDLVGEVTLLVS